MPLRTMVCLAASRKPGGRCYAGIDLETGDWIRPVSARPGHEISDLEALNQYGVATKPLDVVQINFSEWTPLQFQQENWQISPGARWTKLDQMASANLVPMVTRDPLSWPNGDSSWGYGNNRVAELVANGLNHSLRLIQPERLSVSVGRRGGQFDGADDRLVKAHFRNGQNNYTLRVTDPTIEATMWAGADRTEDWSGAKICVSLGGEFHGYAYKLAAAIIV